MPATRGQPGSKEWGRLGCLAGESASESTQPPPTARRKAGGIRMNRTATPVLSRTTSALLVIAPVLMGVGGALSVRFDDQDWNGTLTGMAEHHARADVGGVLRLVGCAL